MRLFKLFEEINFINENKKTKFKNLVILKGVKHQDKRGYLRELVLEKLIKKKFKFQILSVSKKNVLRGLHFKLKYHKVN